MTFEKVGHSGRQNMLRPHIKIWDWDWIFGHAVKALFSLGVRSPCTTWSQASTSLFTIFRNYALASIFIFRAGALAPLLHNGVKSLLRFCLIIVLWNFLKWWTRIDLHIPSWCFSPLLHNGVKLIIVLCNFTRKCWDVLGIDEINNIQFHAKYC